MMTQTYTGACHCGAVRFEVDATLDHVRVCDCSVCRRRGALIHRVPREALRLLTPWSGLTEYRWGTMTGVDYFCAVCGILPFRRPSAPTEKERAQGVQLFEGWAVNARCLEGVDIAALPVKIVRGSLLEI